MTDSPTLHPARTTLPEHNLDLLRAIAVSCVFLDHLSGVTGYGSEFTRWLGQAGVQAFFVHTSLVLMSSLERDGAPTRTGWVPRFYLRRALRIYPLAWVVIAVVLLLHVPGGSLATHWEGVSLPRALANFALVQNLTGQATVLSPLWTLPLELQMYVLLPVCFLIARRGTQTPMALLLLAGVAMAGFYVIGSQSASRIPGLWRFNILEYAPCFLMGVLAYCSLRRAGGKVPVLPSWTWLLIILADIGLVAFAWRMGQHWLDRVIFCGVLGVSIPLVRDAAQSIFTRVAHTIAVYSYGIYLIHLLALRVGFGVLRGSPLPLQLVTVFAVLTTTVFLGYHVIEKPGIAIGQRLLRARKGAISLEATAPPP